MDWKKDSAKNMDIQIREQQNKKRKKSTLRFRNATQKQTNMENKSKPIRSQNKPQQIQTYNERHKKTSSIQTTKKEMDNKLQTQKKKVSQMEFKVIPRENKQIHYDKNGKETIKYKKQHNKKKEKWRKMNDILTVWIIMVLIVIFLIFKVLRPYNRLYSGIALMILAISLMVVGQMTFYDTQTIHQDATLGPTPQPAQDYNITTKTIISTSHFGEDQTCTQNCTDIELLPLLLLIIAIAIIDMIMNIETINTRTRTWTQY